MDEIQSVTASKNVAIIDCGTNTFNLLVAELSGNAWKPLFENKISVKLGSGSFQTGSISSSRFIRGLDALYCHAANIHNFGCDQVFAFATSAVRDADNGVDFIRTANKITGLDIRVLDGDEEAEFICLGVRQSTDLGASPSLLMDIGGGSIEFIIADAKTIYWKQSAKLGVSRLHDSIQPSERMKHDEINQLKSILEKQLKDLKAALQKYPCKTLIGSSGSFDTLSALYRHTNPKLALDAELINEIPLNSYPSIHTWLMGSTMEERLRHPAIPAMRAEYMPIASYIVHYVLDLYPFEKLLHSAYALKEGVVGKVVEGSKLG